LVNVIVEFSGPTQSMTLTVIVPNEGDETALQEQGVAKAKDLALQFAADRQWPYRGAGPHAGPRGPARAIATRSPLSVIQKSSRV
jgi:hypothetical protein